MALSICIQILANERKENTNKEVKMIVSEQKPSFWLENIFIEVLKLMEKMKCQGQEWQEECDGRKEPGKCHVSIFLKHRWDRNDRNDQFHEGRLWQNIDGNSQLFVTGT